MANIHKLLKQMDRIRLNEGTATGSAPVNRRRASSNETTLKRSPVDTLAEDLWRQYQSYLAEADLSPEDRRTLNLPAEPTTTVGDALSSAGNAVRRLATGFAPSPQEKEEMARRDARILNQPDVPKYADVSSAMSGMAQGAVDLAKKFTPSGGYDPAKDPKAGPEPNPIRDSSGTMVRDRYNRTVTSAGVPAAAAGIEPPAGRSSRPSGPEDMMRSDVQTGGGAYDWSTTVVAPPPAPPPAPAPVVAPGTLPPRVTDYPNVVGYPEGVKGVHMGTEIPRPDQPVVAPVVEPEKKKKPKKVDPKPGPVSKSDALYRHNGRYYTKDEIVQMRKEAEQHQKERESKWTPGMETTRRIGGLDYKWTPAQTTRGGTIPGKWEYDPPGLWGFVKNQLRRDFGYDVEADTELNPGYSTAGTGRPGINPKTRPEKPGKK